MLTAKVATKVNIFLDAIFVSVIFSILRVMLYTEGRRGMYKMEGREAAELNPNEPSAQ